MMRTNNPQWEGFLLSYMKEHGLKPSDMKGLVGPRPWKDDPLWSNIEDEEIPEPPYAGVGLSKEAIPDTVEESPYLEIEGETREEYNKRMFDEFFGDIKKEEAMETEITKENLTDKMAAHLADTRRKVIVGDETGWLCEACNRVWSLKQPFCPNKECPGEVETDLKMNVRHATDKPYVAGMPPEDDPYPEEKAGDPLAADPSWLRKHMAEHLEMEDKSLEEKKEVMAGKLKEALGLERLPGEPEPCGVCGAQDAEMCGCCLACEETDGRCKCCEHCHDYPCVCDTTEECPICEARIPIGDACPTGCDADTIELMKLYEEVKNSKDLDFVEKARYLALLKEKMNFAQNEELDDSGVEDTGMVIGS
jgi:hypothetical protein